MAGCLLPNAKLEDALNAAKYAWRAGVEDAFEYDADPEDCET